MRLALAAAVAAVVTAAGGAADGKKKQDDAKPEVKSDDPKPKKDLKIDVGGRVFYRVEGFSGGDETRLLQELASARVEVTMRWQKWLRAVAEAELRGRLRDAYIRVRRHGLGARAGQFKPPVSAIELESAWNLPTATRGLLHDVFTDRMQIAGRRPGVQAEWDGGGRWNPQVVAGVFAATRVIGGAEIPDATPADVNLAARGSIRLGPVDVGLYGESLVTDPSTGTFERWWVAGVDATLDHVWCAQGVRAWAEVMAGSTGFTTGGEATFFAARVIAAWRRWGQEDGERYLEPYGAFELMDPDTGIVDDMIGEGSVGVSAGAWRRLRVSLEASVRFVQRYTPPLLEPSDDPAAAPELVDRTTLRLFIGASW